MIYALKNMKNKILLKNVKNYIKININDFIYKLKKILINIIIIQIKS